MVIWALGWHAKNVHCAFKKWGNVRSACLSSFSIHDRDDTR